MHTNVNLDAVVGALWLLGAGLLLAALGLILVHALLWRKAWRALGALLVGGMISGLYIVLMLGFSVASSEKVLAAGVEKYFCELDCHLAYSVVGVRREASLGCARPEGEFWIVTLRTRFDETTVAPWRDDRPLTPNRRRAVVFDERGRSFPVSAEGQRALAAAGAAGAPLDTPLRPGESYTTELVFDLPADVRRPALLVNESALPTRLIIGHENSFLHAKTKFRLSAAE